ncbi:MAG: T9SS type A sorting domain-containing protein [Bacteroidota bacterium]
MLTLFGSALTAQNCQYELQMFDTFGDGWNGGELTITSGEQTQTFTLNNVTDNGSFSTVCFPVTNDEEIIIGYSSGAFENEVSYVITDNGGNVVLEDGPLPTVADTVLLDTVVCATCVAPSFCGEIDFFRLRSTSVDFQWNSAPDQDGQPSVYLIEFDTLGFTPGTGQFLTTTDTMTRVATLMDTTIYEVYISTLCADGDTSVARGPFTVTTPLSVDVGVTAITDPFSGCDIGSQQIRVGLTNFGGVAQSFIPFDYSINGMTSGVNMPSDGLYTGVLGVDSTEFTTFDMFADFSEPGIYEVQIWTDLPGDQDRSNDTLTVELVSTQLLEALPYLENFEVNDGGWTVAQNGNGAPSWEYGIPQGNLIDRAGLGEAAWVTNLDGQYNNTEESYLLSPCFDFSTLTEDPIISFFLYVETENNFDELYLESTSDNGVTWERVGTAGAGLNWYNDDGNQWWEGDGGFGDQWVIASQTLEGLAESPTARLRFVFSSDGSVIREGVAVDNIYIGPPLTNDLLAAAAINISPVACGSPSDSINLTFFNLGTATADDISLSYQVNGGEVITEDFPDTLASFTEASYTFQTPYDGTQNSENVITVWTSISGDGFTQNDTLTFTVETAGDLPLLETFEDGTADGWTIPGNDQIADQHNANSTILFDNLWASDQFFEAITPNVGVIETGDTLFFDYRYVNFSAGTVATELSEGDSLLVEVIVDCDTVPIQVFKVAGEEHAASTDFTTVAVSLEDYIGTNVQVRFTAYWGEGDYFIDLDNINIRRCVTTFAPAIEVTDASTSISSDGAVVLSDPLFGIGPFSYSWSNGAETASLSDIPAGDYSVTIMDAQGCTEVITLTVDFISTSREFGQELGSISVAPNPTTSGVELFVNLVEQRDLRIQVFNHLGQTVDARTYGERGDLRARFDLRRQPAGIYFIRVFADDQYQTVRVIKQ